MEDICAGGVTTFQGTACQELRGGSFGLVTNVESLDALDAVLIRSGLSVLKLRILQISLLNWMARWVD